MSIFVLQLWVILFYNKHSATEYPSFPQMNNICLLGIPVFGFLSSKYRIFDNNRVIEQNFEQLA